MNKCLVFDIWGDYANFRSIYTTSSPLSYPFPPKPTVIGFISAMLGLDKEIYLNEFYKDDFILALSINNPIKKMRLSENYYDVKNWDPKKKIRHMTGEKALTKDMELTHTQVRIEFVKDPHYRIYFHHSDSDIMNKMKNILEKHSPHYTISLGLSENLANFSYIGEQGYNLVKDNEEKIPVNSVIRKTNIKGEIDFNEGIRIKVVNMPVEMNQERIVSVYDEYIYEENSKEIYAKVNEYIKLENNYNICSL